MRNCYRTRTTVVPFLSARPLPVVDSCHVSFLIRRDRTPTSYTYTLCAVHEGVYWGKAGHTIYAYLAMSTFNSSLRVFAPEEFTPPWTVHPVAGFRVYYEVSRLRRNMIHARTRAVKTKNNWSVKQGILLHVKQRQRGMGEIRRMESPFLASSCNFQKRDFCSSSVDK